MLPVVRVCAGAGLLLISGWFHPAYAQVWSAHAIIDLAVERAEAQRISQADLDFEALVEAVTEHLDGDGQIKKTERETYRQYPVEGVVFEELIAKEGERLDADDERSERERREDFLSEVRERRAKGEEPVPEDENRIDFNEEFVARYDFWFVGEEAVDGHDCWVIELAPRAGDLPVRRRIDNALNNSTGRMWVAKTTMVLHGLSLRWPSRFGSGAGSLEPSGTRSGGSSSRGWPSACGCRPPSISGSTFGFSSEISGDGSCANGPSIRPCG